MFRIYLNLKKYSSCHKDSVFFAARDAIMSRFISTSISLLWTEEQIKEKGEKMVGVVKKVLSEMGVTA